GQRWQMTVRLRAPHGNLNPHGFDTEAWMLERGIRASGYVRDAQAARQLAPMVWRPGYMVQRARERIRQRLSELLAGRAYGGIVIALAIGDQRAIPEPQWEILTRTGTNHLMSISGLHITLVAGLVFGLATRLWRRSPLLVTRVSPLHAATLFGLIAALIYAALAGFAIPAQRAVCMLGVVAASLWSGWRWPAPAVLGVALLFVLLLDPMAVTSAGFWLSFGAVAAILMVGSSCAHGDGVLRTWVRIQWAITVALIPLLLVLFQKVSVISPIANGIAIPLISVCIAPLSLLLVVLPFEPVAMLVNGALQLLFGVLERLSALPGAIWQQHTPLTWSVALAVAGVALIALPRGYPGRWLGVVLMLPMFVVKPPAPATGELWLTVLDVGQGLAVVARTANHTVLFDAGPDYRGGGDAGRNIVVPYLRGEGIARLDLLVASHEDLDHAGGVASVVAALDVAQLVSSFDAKAPGNKAGRCHAGQAWTFDGVGFEILHPGSDRDSRDSIGDNDRSCVMRIQSAHGTVLLPADIERRSERQLLATASPLLRADVLVAPHHGSGSSSSEAFVEAVAARAVVFPVGYMNRYGHPAPLVVARYVETGAMTMRTDQTGAVIVRFGRERMEISRWRDQYRRYWHQ
ncbi:MAG: DNA internalization-related competence protein ComEC/Rec2, partial [Burkholderiales bacterium]